MTVMIATGLAGTAVLAEVVAFAQVRAARADRKTMGVYAGTALYAAGILALAVTAGIGAVPAAFFGPAWLPPFVVPAACVLAAALIAAASLHERPGDPSRWLPAGLCMAFLALAALSLGA